jgi:hypothetical protein
MTAHTPGPWHRADSTQVIGACGSHVADCAHAKDEGPTAGIACANAALIAAAPDLLDALREMTDWYAQTCASPSEDSLLAEARAIIAKAEGAQS